jgi:hypothetical protein
MQTKVIVTVAVAKRSKMLSDMASYDGGINHDFCVLQ